MLNSARGMPFFLDQSWLVWAANRRPPKADQRAISTSSRPARVRRPPASGEEARQMRLRTPAIRRDRPTVRGSPALRARSTFAGRVPAELSAKNHPCDAKNHARPRKYLEQNSFSTRGVQVRLDICFSKAASFLGSADAAAHRGAAMHSQIKIRKPFFSVIEYIGSLIAISYRIYFLIHTLTFVLSEMIVL